MHEILTLSDFEPYLGKRFLVHVNDQVSIELELVEIKDMGTDLMETFSLLFRGPRDRVFFQNTYRVTQPDMGEFNLFLGPVDIKRTNDIYYEAVFNRFRNNLT